MKVSYEKLVELNRSSTLETSPNHQEQLNCFWLIQAGVEKFLTGEHLSNDYINFLIQMGVLIPEEQEEKKKIVEPFNFVGNDRPESN